VPESHLGSDKVVQINQEAQLRALATNIMLGRSALQSQLGMAYGTKRDLYETLGYKKTLIFEDYLARWNRQDIASRIISAPVSATWRDKPDVVEDDDPTTQTAFEKAWTDLVEAKKVFNYLKRVDEISGVGRYGVLVIGFADGQKDLGQPAQSASDILYLQTYMENNAEIETWQRDYSNPRFGMPEQYKINFATADKSDISSRQVHWSRLIHVAEGLVEDEVYGTPRLKKVFNRLQDLETISGGSSEMFWRGAFPGMGIRNDTDATMQAQDLDDLETEIDNYVHDLKRYMRLQNMSVEQLEVQVADPSAHVDVQITLISAATGIPKRILMGSERGELASSQDKENWADRIEERKNDYAGPRILQPFVERLIEVGVLPEPKEFKIVWTDSHTQSEADEASVSKIRTEALAAYANSANAAFVVPPEVFLKKFLNFDHDDVQEVNDALGNMDLIEKQQQDEEKQIAREEAARQEAREERDANRSGAAPGQSTTPLE
jgi:hypothetical protein